MRASNRRTRRLNALGGTSTLTGLILSIFLILGQFGIVAAGAADRDRDGSFTSDTTVISDDGGSAGGTGDGGGGVTRTSSSTGGIVRTDDLAAGGGSPRAPGAKVRICHGVGGVGTGPYVEIEVSQSGVDGAGGGDHFGEHTGPIFDPTVHSLGGPVTWGDIIPPFDVDGDPLPPPTGPGGLNWTAQGQAIWNAGCNLPGPAPAALATPTKSASGTAAVGSTNFTYTITTSNTGGTTAADVTIVDNVPAGLSVTSVTWVKSNPTANGTCTTSNAVSCNVGNLVPGQSVTVTIVMTVGAGACPSISNTGSVSAAGITSVNTNTVNTTIDPASCPAGAAPDISIVKGGPTSIDSGDSFSYTLTVTNLGNAPALGVTVSDSVPANLAINTVTPDSVPPTPTCSFAGQAVSCTLGDVAAGASVIITINVTHNGTSCTALSNTGTVSTTSANDSNTANHSSTVNTTVTCSSDVTINKSGPGQVAEGGQITYTVTVTNNGTAGAPGIVITDDLADAPLLTNVQAQINGGVSNPSCAVGAGNVVTCTFGLASASSPNDQAVITITADVGNRTSVPALEPGDRLGPGGRAATERHRDHHDRRSELHAAQPHGPGSHDRQDGEPDPGERR